MFRVLRFETGKNQLKERERTELGSLMAEVITMQILYKTAQTEIRIVRYSPPIFTLLSSGA